MGWICPRCGSENLFSDRTCIACRKEAMKAWRLYQRFKQAYLKARPYEVVQARRSAPLSGIQLACRNLLRLSPALVVACMLCVALNVLPSLDGAGWTQRRNRLEAQTTRAVSIVAGKVRSNAAQLTGKVDARLDAAAGEGDILAGAAKRIDAGGVRAERIARKLSGIEPDAQLLSQQVDAIRQRISSMDDVLRQFMQRAEYAASVVREAIPFL